MQLTDGEKLILIMLSDLLEAQEVNKSVDPEFIKSAIYYDCLWGLPWEYPGIPFTKTSTPTNVDWVMNILQMWTTIEASYGKLSPEDKERVELQANPFGTNPQFSGFDVNSESEQLRITRFLINNLKRFLNFKNRDLNSQIPLSGRYQRMYSIYEKLFPNIEKGILGTDQIIEILCQGSKK